MGDGRDEKQMLLQQRIYSARPINTYTGTGAEVGKAYIAFLSYRFPSSIIVDPGDPAGEISRRAKELMTQHMINPATGKEDQKYYNEHGSKFVMAYFTKEVVGPCTVGTGLLLPVTEDGKNTYAVGAGVAAELVKLDDQGKPTWLIACTKKDEQLRFSMYRVKYVIADERRGLDSVSKKPLHTFVTDSVAFRALSVDETRARMYTPRPDGTWDREKLQPYFLD